MRGGDFVGRSGAPEADKKSVAARTAERNMIFAEAEDMRTTVAEGFAGVEAGDGGGKRSFRGFLALAAEKHAANLAVRVDRDVAEGDLQGVVAEFGRNAGGHAILGGETVGEYDVVIARDIL